MIKGSVSLVTGTTLAEFDRAAGVLRIESTFFGSLADTEEVPLDDIRSVEVQSVRAAGGYRLALITRSGDVILPLGSVYTGDKGNYRARDAVEDFLTGR